VIDVPSAAGRTYYEEALGNLRPHARPSLSMTFRVPTADRPLKSELLERHEFSSQSFVPVDVGRWLIVVAPHARAGGPDMTGLQAFIADGSQGVTYRPNTWHHGLTTLDRPGRFAVFMWRAGEKDEEFVPVAPFTIRIP
jgi:ureidoglycolate lyase